jgi:two-component system NtrC family response regulator
VKGAFTGAEHATLGFFRSADGGTLFLDEIGEMGLAVQAKLLRCLQERSVVPLGGVEPIPVDVRIIAATHRDLKAMVRRGEFRQDLYYRLNVVPLTVPPLRERIADLPALAEHFLAQFAELHGGAVKQLSPDALAALLVYDWPGNVRELANVMERVHVLAANEVVTTDDLPEDIRAAGRERAARPPGEIVPLAVMERSLVAQALRAACGNQSRAAQMLQIDRRRLYRKVRAYKLEALTRGTTD